MPTKGAGYAHIQLNPHDDADLIRWLDRQPVASRAIKSALRLALNMPAPVQQQSAQGATSAEIAQLRQENADLRRLLQDLQRQIDELPGRLARDGYTGTRVDSEERIDEDTRNKRIARLRKANW